MSLNRCFCSSFFFTKVGWENWNDFETLMENGRNIFQTTVAYIYHLGKSTKFNQKLKKKQILFISTKNRNSKFNSLSSTANTIYTYLAIIDFSNIYIYIYSPPIDFWYGQGFYVGKIHPGHILLWWCYKFAAMLFPQKIHQSLWTFCFADHPDIGPFFPSAHIGHKHTVPTLTLSSIVGLLPLSGLCSGG